MNTQQIMAMLHRKKPIIMNTTETNDQNPWRPLEPGEIIQEGDEGYQHGTGPWITITANEPGINEAYDSAEHYPIRTRRPRPAPASECKCDLRIKLVGDGCSVCNPNLHAEYCEPDPDEKTGGGDQQTAREWVTERWTLQAPASRAYVDLLTLADRADMAEAAWNAEKRAHLIMCERFSNLQDDYATCLEELNKSRALAMERMAERDRLREALERMMDSCTPNPNEHPVMYAAKLHGRSVLNQTTNTNDQK